MQDVYNQNIRSHTAVAMETSMRGNCARTVRKYNRLLLDGYTLYWWSIMIEIFIEKICYISVLQLSHSSMY